MKKLNVNYLWMLLLLLLPGCQIVGDIFKAGVWVGVIIVLAIIVIVIRLLSGGKK